MRAAIGETLEKTGIMVIDGSMSTELEQMGTAPQHMESLIRELRSGCSLPVAVYPNSGENYDPRTKAWHGSADGVSFREYAKRFMDAGASSVGGCCTTVDSHIREVVKARELVKRAGGWRICR